MSSDYWSKFTQQRLTRRRALGSIAGAGAALAAASLVGCGNDGEGGGGGGAEGDRSGLLGVREDSTSAAKPGGVLPSYVSSDAAGFDGIVAVAASTKGHNTYAYSRLVQYKVVNLAKGEKIVTTAVDPDAAESYEVSDDGLQITFRMRPDLKLDPRPPTNGRVYDANDVVFSWDRFATLSGSRGVLAYDANKNAPITAVTAPDARTVVMKLAYPSASLLASLPFSLYWPLHPREVDGGFDPRAEMRGSGAWMLSRYEASGSFEYRKNPNWYRSDRPFLDGVDLPIITEYAQGLAQFRAGRIASYAVNDEDMLSVRREQPKMVMLANDSFSRTVGQMLWFNFHPGSPWLDDRLRRALSMQIDRDLFIETVNNTARFTGEGLPVQTRWNSHIGAGWDDFWVDPKTDAIGDGGKYFKHDPAEAKKLVQATGRDVLESAWTVIAGNEYGLGYRNETEILKGMFEEGGSFRFNTVPVDYRTVFIGKISSAPRLTGGHEFDGAAYGAIADFPDVDDFFGNHYISGGAYYKFEEGYPNDPQWDSLLRAQRLERDPDKRVELIHEFQRYAATKMYTICRPGQALGFSLHWPWLGNQGAFGARASGAHTTLLHNWLDESKRTS